jgi:hypothetical protein
LARTVIVGPHREYRRSTSLELVVQVERAAVALKLVDADTPVLIGAHLVQGERLGGRLTEPYRDAVGMERWVNLFSEGRAIKEPADESLQQVSVCVTELNARAALGYPRCGANYLEAAIGAEHPTERIAGVDEFVEVGDRDPAPGTSCGVVGVIVVSVAEDGRASVRDDKAGDGRLLCRPQVVELAHREDERRGLGGGRRFDVGRRLVLGHRPIAQPFAASNSDRQSVDIDIDAERTF